MNNHLRDTIKRIGICTFVILCNIPISESGANNLHLFEGVSTADVIGGDIFFEIVEPLELEYTYRIRPAKDFGAPFNASFSAIGVPLVPILPMYGCTMPANFADIRGSVALVERGICSFKSKTIIAENAGAKAIIITDESDESEEQFIEMIDDESVQETHIPAGFLLGRNGYIIRRTLQKLNRKYAIINLPLNLTFTPVNKINQPPWLEW